MSDSKETAPALRRYVVSVDGYTSEEFRAPTAGKARYRAFQLFRDAGSRITFREFLARSTVLHLGAVHA